MIIKSQKPDSKIRIVKEPSAIPGMYKNGINRRSIYKTGLSFQVVGKITSFPQDRSRNRTPLGVVSIFSEIVYETSGCPRASSVAKTVLT